MELVLKKVICLESVADKRAEAVYNVEKKAISVASSICIEYTRQNLLLFLKTGMYSILNTIPCPILLGIFAFVQLFCHL